MSTQETIRLYDNDAYATEFEAAVLSCEPKADTDNLYEVVLQIKNGVIIHTVDIAVTENEAGSEPDKTRNDKTNIDKTKLDKISAGSHISGKIDWQHRFYNMQQHSGEHIFSGIVHSRFGFENVGFHLSDSVVTMDFSGVISPEDIADIEREVNVAITKNIHVEVTYPSKMELESLEYRSKIEIEGQVRIVTVPGYDVCACCAPHVKRTGEIGMLKVMNYQNYKGGVRISILCGFRALEAFRQKSQIISELMGIFTTNQEAIIDNVTKLKALNQSLKSELGSAKAEILDYKIASLPTDIDNAILFEADLDSNAARNCVNKLVEKYSGVPYLPEMMKMDIALSSAVKTWTAII